MEMYNGAPKVSEQGSLGAAIAFCLSTRAKYEARGTWANNVYRTARGTYAVSSQPQSMIVRTVQGVNICGSERLRNRSQVEADIRALVAEIAARRA